MSHRANEAPLLQAIMELRANAPRAFEAYVSELRAYADATAKGLLRATPADFQVAQGYARMADELATMLIQAPERLKKIMARSEEKT